MARWYKELIVFGVVGLVIYLTTHIILYSVDSTQWHNKASIILFPLAIVSLIMIAYGLDETFIRKDRQNNQVDS